MEQQQPQQQEGNQTRTSTNQSEKSTTEPVRSRWTPKPEQILILESIFNSGMVNPPKDETVRIRKLLEKFGAVGDANVFYWFQNRRSRSRRRQRQMQQQQQQQQQHQQQPQPFQFGCYGGGGAIQCDQAHVTLPAPAVTTVGGFGDSSSLSNYLISCGSSSSPSSSASSGGGGGGSGVDGFFSATPQIGFPEIDHTSPGSSVLYPHVAPNMNFHTGIITVFINGIATEVPRGPIDIKTLFGEDVILVHSSGVPVPTTDYGFLMQSLHHGESYFLVPKPTQG